MTAPCEIEKKKMKPTSSQVRVGGEDGGDSGEAGRGSDRSDEEEGFASDFVDHRHGEDGGAEVHGAEKDGLLVAGERGVAGEAEDVVGVVKDGVDASELIEHADGDGEKDGQAVFALEEGLVFGGTLEVDGVDDFFELGLGVGGAHHLEDLAGFVDAILRDEPA